MKISLLTCLGSARAPCRECGGWFQELAVLEIGASIGHPVEIRFCPTCFAALRSAMTHRRRPLLNPRLYAALEALAAGGWMLEDELRRIVGPYATNTLHSLCTRGFVECAETDHAYAILPKGRRVLEGSTLEPGQR